MSFSRDEGSDMEFFEDDDSDEEIEEVEDISEDDDDDDGDENYTNEMDDDDDDDNDLNDGRDEEEEIDGFDNENEEEEEEVEEESEDEDEDENLMSKFMTGEIDLPGGDEKYEDFFDPPEKETNMTHPDKIAKKIEELEDMMLQKKHWRLRGEIEAADRPENALLEEVLEYDDAATEKPQMSEDIEETIRKRVIEDVRNQTFDDVKRRKASAPVREEFRRQLVVNSDKPKPLSEIYEEEYKRAQGVQKEEDPGKEELRNEILDLFGKLDALSNMHFVPKLPLQETKLKKPVAAVTLEEAIPTAVSSSQLLTPKEAVGKQIQPIGNSELTKTDKHRYLRRKKKREGAIVRDRRDRFGESQTDSMRKVLKMAHKPQSNIVISGKVATMWGNKVKRAMKPHGGRKGRKKEKQNKTKILE